MTTTKPKTETGADLRQAAENALTMLELFLQEEAVVWTEDPTDADGEYAEPESFIGYMLRSIHELRRALGRADAPITSGSDVQYATPRKE